MLYAADDPTSTGQAQNFRGAAAALGLDVAGFESWDPKAEDYTALFDAVKKSGADAVVLAGLTDQNGATLIKDKVSVLGSNEKLPLIAFDGFAQQSTIDECRGAAAGMFASVPGRAPENLTGSRRSSTSTSSRAESTEEGWSCTRRTPARRPRLCWTQSPPGATIGADTVTEAVHWRRSEPTASSGTYRIHPHRRSERRAGDLLLRRRRQLRARRPRSRRRRTSSRRPQGD